MTDAQTPLWDELKQLLRLAAAIFGQPAELYEDRVAPALDVLLLRGWVAALEGVARALLAIMAAGLPAPSRAPRKAAGPKRGRDAAAPSTEEKQGAAWETPVDAAVPDSERWAGAAFRLAPRAGTGGRHGPFPGPRRFLTTRTLAFRFEALIRVAEAPLPYARRLARRLRADPALAARILKPPTTTGRRPPPYADLVVEALDAARLALAPPGRESG